MNYIHNDGGREAAGFKGETNDCVTRAIAIAAELPYSAVYAAITQQRKAKGDGRTARHRVPKDISRPYIESLGFRWAPTMRIGTGCKVHLTADELPKGRLIVKVSRHLVAVIDGVIHDTHDCSRDGSRCVYGYYVKD